MALRKPRTTSESKIAAIRLANAETQEEFAARLGVSLRSVKRWERENALPETESILRTLRALARKHRIDFSA